MHFLAHKNGESPIHQAGENVIIKGQYEKKITKNISA